MKNACRWLFLFLLSSGPASVSAAQVAHAFVALCDNATQGIVPVPARIGNGDDPESNLYWGCDDGLGRYFKRSKQWRLVAAEKNAAPAVILERQLYKHRERDVWLVAHAYRGAAIKQALEDFLRAASSRVAGTVTLKAEETTPPLEQVDFVAFIGHNGLMDFSLPFPTVQRQGASAPAVVLCCKSDAYFTAGLRQAGVEPCLMTRQLMYPGSFLLHAALEGWVQKEKPALWLERAARAYAANQKISVKAARGVFTVP